MVKNKKSLSEVITIGLLLVVIIVGFIGMKSWYTNLTNDYNNKQLQNLNEIPENYEILGLKIENQIPVFYLWNKNSKYTFIRSIKMNNYECKILSNKVLKGSSIVKIHLDCNNNIKKLNDYFISLNKISLNGKIAKKK